MGTGNPSWKKICREQEHLDRWEKDTRDLARKVTLNENFFSTPALKQFAVAARELTKDTERRMRTNRLRELRREPVGSEARQIWYRTGDGSVGAVMPKGKLTLRSKYVLTLGSRHRKVAYTYW